MLQSVVRTRERHLYSLLWLSALRFVLATQSATLVRLATHHTLDSCLSVAIETPIPIVLSHQSPNIRESLNWRRVASFHPNPLPALYQKFRLQGRVLELDRD